MKTAKLIEQIREKKSLLCIGLDVDLDKIPRSLLQEEDPIFRFNKEIIDATHHLAVAYKPYLAFYEAYGITGLQALGKTIEYLISTYPEIFTIADAKRGDIGNTATMYARAFFDDLGFDSITVAPYMGKDSVEPFLEYQDKHTILLALTSNPGAVDFQTQKIDGEEFFKKVIRTSQAWKNGQNLMYVVGATQADYLRQIRALIPESFLLIPGIGAQGGNLEEVCRYGMNRNGGLLINSSRGILYASGGDDFAGMAAAAAEEMQRQMVPFLNKIRL